MAHLVIAHIDDVILIPTGACGTRVAIRKRLHGPLQDSSCFLAQVEYISQDRCFGDLYILNCGIKLKRMICSSSTCSSLSRIFRVISDLSFSPFVTCFTPNGVHCSPCDASPSSSLLAQAVAYTSHGLNQAWVGRVLFQLFTQPSYMHI